MSRAGLTYALFFPWKWAEHTTCGKGEPVRPDPRQGDGTLATWPRHNLCQRPNAVDARFHHGRRETCVNWVKNTVTGGNSSTSCDNKTHHVDENTGLNLTPWVLIVRRQPWEAKQQKKTKTNKIFKGMDVTVTAVSDDLVTKVTARLYPSLSTSVKELWNSTASYSTVELMCKWWIRKKKGFSGN